MKRLFAILIFGIFLSSSLMGWQIRKTGETTKKSIKKVTKAEAEAYAEFKKECIDREEKNTDCPTAKSMKGENALTACRRIKCDISKGGQEQCDSAKETCYGVCTTTIYTSCMSKSCSGPQALATCPTICETLRDTCKGECDVEHEACVQEYKAEAKELQAKCRTICRGEKKLRMSNIMQGAQLLTMLGNAADDLLTDPSTTGGDVTPPATIPSPPDMECDPEQLKGEELTKCYCALGGWYWDPKTGCTDSPSPGGEKYTYPDIDDDDSSSDSDVEDTTESTAEGGFEAGFSSEAGTGALSGKGKKSDKSKKGLRYASKLRSRGLRGGSSGFPSSSYISGSGLKEEKHKGKKHSKDIAKSEENIWAIIGRIHKEKYSKREIGFLTRRRYKRGATGI